MNLPLDREARIAAPNPLGLAGIEFVEYTTPRPQALGQVLEQMGFRPVARQRRGQQPVVFRRSLE